VYRQCKRSFANGDPGLVYLLSTSAELGLTRKNKPRLALDNNTAGVREGEDANRTREAGLRDEVEGVVANMLNSFRNGAVGFIEWLDATLELRRRRGHRLTHRGRGYSWRRCVTLPGKAFLLFSLADYNMNRVRVSPLDNIPFCGNTFCRQAAHQRLGCRPKAVQTFLCKFNRHTGPIVNAGFTVQ
jgi:hypothetical protein